MRLPSALAVLLAVASCGASSEPWSRTPTCYLRRSMVVRVRSEDRITVREEDEIWIASNGDRSEGYDSFTETAYGTLGKFEGAAFDSSGRLIRKLAGDDQGVSTVTSGAVYSEHRTRYHTLSAPQVPYLVRRAKEYEIRSLLMWPDWIPQESVPVREAELRVIVERPVPYRFRTRGGVSGPDSTRSEDGFPERVWRASDLPAYRGEYRAAPESRYQTAIFFCPERFDLEGHAGSAENWVRLGDFYWTLFSPQGELKMPVPEVEACRALENPRDRVRRLYRTLQRDTRYALVHLGMDGIRPHPVEEVRRNRYGDCKDLSLYLIAMLRQAGIEACPALVLTRDVGVLDSATPEGRFNHCMACVPTGGDTLWLECTSDETAAENVPAADEGSSALIVQPGQSRLVRIPESAADDNGRRVRADAELTMDRQLTVSGTVLYSGDRSVEARSLLKSMDEKGRREWFLGTLIPGAGAAVFDRLRTWGLSDPDSAVRLEFSFRIPFFARNAGDRIFMEPRIFNRFLFDGEAPSARRLPLRNPGRFSDSDSVLFRIPVCLSVSAGSDSTVLDSAFGRYDDRSRPTRDGFVWTSRFRLDRLDVPLSEYPDYYKFMKHAGTAAGRKVLLTTRAAVPASGR